MLRLTLRTLLAYLDDILPPAESRAIGQQIAQEPAINDLVTRIQQVMRRRRLLADSADPDHAEVDPNDVAEYLDNVLTPSRVADLEKRLLEHDSDLAEVASVHQILSLVLGKPSDIPQRAKERAYKLIRSKGRSHLELDPIGPTRGGVGTPLTPEPTPLGGTADAEPGSPSFSIGASTLILLLVGLLGMTVYFTLSGQKERPLPPLAQKETPPEREPTRGVGDPVASAGAMAQGAVPANPAAADRPGEAIIPEPSPADRPGEAIIPEPSPADPSPSGAAPEPRLPKDELDPLPGESAAVGSADKKESAEEMLPSPAERVLPETTAEDRAPPEAEKERVVPVGTYGSESGILLRNDGDGWSRLKPRTKLQSGDEIAHPAPGRARLELPVGIELELVGPTQARLHFNPSVDFSLELRSGGLLLPSSDEPAVVELKFGPQTGTLLLEGPGKVVAIERRATRPGEGTSEPAPLDIYGIEGTVEWSHEGESSPLEAGERLTLRWNETASPSLQSASPPAWVKSTLDGPTEKLLNRLSDLISFESNPADRYRELINDNNKEIRLLAVEGLAAMGEADLLAEAIRHPKHEPVRRRSLEALRAMIGEGESSRVRVKTTLDKVYGREGDRLLAMLDPATLVGKSPREVFGSWIGQLQAAELPIREAAIAQLSAITGRDLSYSAESTSSQRNTVAGRWSKWLDSQTDEQLADLLPGSP